MEWVLRRAAAMLRHALGLVVLLASPSAFGEVQARPPGPAGYLALGLLMIFVVALLIEWLSEGDQGDAGWRDDPGIAKPTGASDEEPRA